MASMPDDPTRVDRRLRAVVPTAGHLALYVVPGAGGGEWRTRPVAAYGITDDRWPAGADPLAPRALVVDLERGALVDLEDTVARTWDVVTFDETADLAHRRPTLGHFVRIIDEHARRQLTVDGARQAWADIAA